MEILSLLWVSIVVVLTALSVLAQANQCDSENAIFMPSEQLCMVPYKATTTWENARLDCLSQGGALYQPKSLVFDSNDLLMRCLAGLKGDSYRDFWFDAVGTWFQHFLWWDSTRSSSPFINQVTYCSSEPPPTDQKPIRSDMLSVDFCVSTCHNGARRFIVVNRRNKSPECVCVTSLPDEYKQECSTPYVDYNNRTAYYIIHSQENSLVDMQEIDSFTSSEIMCTTVDSQTFKHREMKSATCFTRLPFLCKLDNSTGCPVDECEGPLCIFESKGKCMKRVNYQYTWFEARAYCANLKGDLWTLTDFQEMGQIGQYLSKDIQYWTSGSNYIWNFNATYSERTLPDLNIQNEKYKCGHLFHQPNSRWKWSDAACTQPKSYLCQFNYDVDISALQENETDLVCPWPLSPIIVPPTFQTVAPVAPTAGQITSGDDDDDIFPIAALIAGIIAGLILLTCLAVALTFCWRRSWADGKFQKSKEPLAFIPYFSGGNQLAIANGNGEFESMSNSGHMRSNMSFVSEHGSQVGLVKGEAFQSSGFANNGYSYNDQSEMTMDARQMQGQSQNLMANSSMDERGFASSYNTMGGNSKGVMTLEAEMNIPDEADVAAMQGSSRGKPEVALVTEGVDMNFTVNHAASHSNLDVLEPTMEEITIPVSDGAGMTQVTLTGTLPERVAEAHVIRTLSREEL